MKQAKHGNPMERKVQVHLISVVVGLEPWHQGWLVYARRILGASQTLSSFDGQGQHFVSVFIALSGGDVVTSSPMCLTKDGVGISLLALNEFAGHCRSFWPCWDYICHGHH